MNEWYKDWFSSEFYTTVYAHRNDSDAKLLSELILSKVELKKDDYILDAACGAGRYSKIFAGYDFNVVGFDLSLVLLNLALADNHHFNKNHFLINSDIRSTYFKRKFSLIFNLFTSFGYFNTEKENFLFFQNALDFIDENGVLVFDYFNSSYIKKNVIPYSEKNVDGFLVKETRITQDNRVIKNIDVTANNQTLSFLESVALYDHDFLIDKFNSLGYNITDVYGDYKGSPFNEENSERIIIFMKKR
ncbi:MAG: class I SAM-dependent methyltransferase [Melioribacteraceae bacterium]|nr:class I SAM-dependent methyltransferase [Melioribacteraceae bacterium]